MKLLISLGLIAYATAYSDKDAACDSFIQVTNSHRGKRSPQNFWRDGVSTTGGYTTAGYASTTGTANGGVTTTAGITTTGARTTGAPPATTSAGYTGSTGRVTTQQTSSIGMPDEAPASYLFLLDATGSMQKLSGNRKGQEFVIKKFNKFLKTFRTRVSKGDIPDGKIAFVTFNKKAKWTNYNSITEMEELTKATYNPGWATNLYDTMGCSLKKFKEEMPSEQQNVYVISDGFHQYRNNKHTANDVKQLVRDFREDGMAFTFYAMIDMAKKEKLKKDVANMGLRGAEIRTVDFEGASFGVILRSILSKSSKIGSKSSKNLPLCSEKFPCAKGRRGGMCRQERKLFKAQGKCRGAQ